MRVNTLSRRMWLRGAAGVAVAIPFLPSLVERAFGQTAPARRRFVCVYSPLGAAGGGFWPNAPGGPSFDPKYRELKLSSISGEMSPVLSSFGALKEKLLVLRGLDGLVADQGHGSQAMALTGRGNNALNDNVNSIDQVMAASSKVYPTAPQVRVLATNPMVGQVAADGITWLSYKKGVGAVTPRSDLNAMVRSFFMASPPPPGPNLKAFVVDHVVDDYRRTLASRRLSRVDAQRLDGHMEGLLDLQRKSVVAPVSCAPPSTHNLPVDDGLLRNFGVNNIAAAFDPVMSAYIDLIVAAIKCGVTQVALLPLGQPGSAGDPRNYSNLGVPGIASDSHHGHSHKVGTPTDQAAPFLVAIQKMFASKVAELMTKLDTPEASGRTYLDNSIVLWTNELGDPYNHRSYCMPVVIGGSGGGALRTGLLMDYQNRVANRSVSEFGASPGYGALMGLPYQRLLITLMRAMGLEASDWEDSPGSGFGEYSGAAHLARTDVYGPASSRFDPLPGLLV